MKQPLGFPPSTGLITRDGFGPKTGRFLLASPWVQGENGRTKQLMVGSGHVPRLDCLFERTLNAAKDEVGRTKATRARCTACSRLNLFFS